MSASNWWRRETHNKTPNTARPAVRTTAYHTVKRKRMEWLRMTSGLSHNVTEAAQGMDQLRLMGVDFVAQLAHEYFEVVLADFVIESPHRFKNSVAADGAAAVAHAKFEQVIFAGRKIDDFAG